MRITIAAATAGLLLVGCDKTDTGPAKREPGSWNQQIDVVELSGPGVTAAQKAQVTQMMKRASAINICITPEFSAAEDIQRNLTSMGGQAGNCIVADQKLTGSTVDFTANCKSRGKDVRIVAGGTNSATAQNFKITVETIGATADGGRMVMTIASKREGDCKPGDVTPPMPKVAS